MKRVLFLSYGVLCLLVGVLGTVNLSAQTFTGTNAPGGATNFSFTLGSGATNLSLVISNTAGSYSYLRLARGRTPTDTDFDFISRLNGVTNQINLQSPEFVATNYGLLVSTPAASATHAFSVLLTTNRTDLRTIGYPVLKPLAFTAAGTLTNSPGLGAFHYFQVDMPTNLPGWRLVLSSSNANVDLYVRRGGLPNTGAYDKASFNQAIDTVIFNDTESTSNTYFIGVYLPAQAATNTVYTLTAEIGWLTQLAWDPGTADTGTQVFTNASASGGDYYFKITTQNTANGVWRTALKVTGGEADVYLLYGSPAQTYSYSYASTRVGSDGFVLAQNAHWSAGQDWYITIHATPGAQWTLMTGEAFVQQLPALAADASSGTNATVGPEGMRFFKTTMTPGTLAWRINLSGLTNTILVHSSKAPLLYSSPGSGYFDWSGPGQLLLVPNYVNIGSQYIIGVIGAPGFNFTLDSRQQPVADLGFNAATNVTTTTYGYVTYRVQVPIQQIAWQVNLLPASGDPNIAVRRDNVPNEYNNDAFSEVASPTVGDSVTLVPPVLSDGTYYLTVYGAPPYSCTLTNGQPTITDVHYVFQITNDVPARAGWRFYRVASTAEQLGTYGWDLELSNHVAGTEIALRRNAVPSRWVNRNCNANCSGGNPLAYLDYSGTGGFLQRPGHQADIWYIGVYQPATALGSFVLSGQELTATPLNFDGAGSSQNITNQIAGKWQYFIFNVPTNTLGWDLRLTNIVAGDPGLTICRDRLPFDLGTHDYNGNGWYYPWSYSTWPSGYSWGAGYDWTGYYYNPGGANYIAKLLAMGLHNPLEAGTYYVGVNNYSPGPMTYSLVSRGIGTNQTIPVLELAFTGGTRSTNGLPAREAAYFHTSIASNTPSWKVRLAVTNGEALLLVQKDCLPNVVGGSYTAASLGGGRRMQKAGDEQYLLLPDPGQTNLPAGDYYLAVVSEGQNPASSTIGTGACGFVLTSFGVETTNQIGTLNAAGPDISTADTLFGGETKHYQFTVSTNVLAMEVRLDSRIANPRMTLRADGQAVTTYSGYGRDGGQSYQWSSDSIINISTPPSVTFDLAVQADTFVSGYSNAAYTVVVHALTSTPVAFDGGVINVVGHTNNVWRFFEFTVPSNTFGWDIRLTNTVGDPRLVVCRDLAPNGFFTGAYPGYGWYYPYTYTTWPSSNLWAASYDWTYRTYDANGTNRSGHILEMGMGNPLEPGHYYAGVCSAVPYSAGSMNYTLLSRGIGTNQTIPLYDLPFIGSVSGTNIPPREAVYYKVQVPPGQPSWKLRLVPTNSEAMMLIQKDYLPNVVGGGYSPADVAGGRRQQKVDNDLFTQLPRYYEYTITNGTYYIAVVSEGMNPLNGSYTGTNASSYTLYSYGPAPTNLLGTVDPSGATDISYPDTLEGTEFKYYRFSVPPGTLSLEVHLDSRVANPGMTLRADNDLPYPTDGISYSDGHPYTWANDTLINLASPAVTNYTLSVQAHSYLSGYSNASYTIRLHALGLAPVAFDGGTNRIVGQVAGTWQYFTLTVPSNAFGWDLRLTNITSGEPRMSIRRETLPDSLYTHTDTGGGWYYPYSSSSWPIGYQWGVDYDWTSDYYSNSGSNSVGTVFQCGMGNPLSPGVYIVGVLNGNSVDPMSYTILSRGIGTNMTIPIYDLPFTGSVSTNGLRAREAAYYKVTLPAGLKNWKTRLAPGSGEALMEIQKDFLPSVTAGATSPTQIAGGRKLQKASNEHFLELPQPGQSVIPGGTYYIAVISEGQNPHYPYIGSNSCDFTLTSYGSLVYSNLGTISTTETARTNTLEAGEIKVYQFTVPAAADALELRLTDKTGNATMQLALSSNAPMGYYSYGYDYGEYYSWAHDRIITIPNPAAGSYSLNVQADPATDANYALRVRLLAPADLAFDRTLSTPSITNVASGTLADLQRNYFRVTVPASFNGQPVLGWKLTIDHTQGSPRLRVRKDFVPTEAGYAGDSPYQLDQMAIVPPFLTPGTWYVEVQGQGTSQFTLTSSALLLERPAWNMPAIGGTVTTPGLPPGGPVFGDTGVATNGTALPGDQGTDLEQGRFHYYAVNVPSNNVGILRTRLDAISGDPNLYIRTGNAPTLSHVSAGDNGSQLFERSLTANVGSEYGNWVPLDGRYELQLAPGAWYIAVQAGGNSNVRYRLLVSLGVITSLTYDGSPLTGQTLAAGDWRYYRVFVPTNCFTAWTVNFAQNLGDVMMYVRDTTPPGQGGYTTDYREWNSDVKNFGPYPTVDPPGATNFPCPPLRPGNTYYLGFRAVNDATFSVSSTTNTTTINYTNVIPFYGGSVTSTVPANGVLKYRIDVPADATRWIHTSTHSNTVSLYLEQGSIPLPPSQHHWFSSGAADSTLNVQLYNSYWPWLPAYSYFLLVTNTTGIPQNFVFHMNGKNAATDDNDGDGLPDAWELACWPSIFSYTGTQDPDGDGVNNMDEYLEGTVACDSASFNPRLLVTASGGGVSLNPPGIPASPAPKVRYAMNTGVQLTPTPSPGYSFLAWSGDASGSANPLNIVMTTNKNITAIFGITNNSGADYKFQMNLLSSTGSPPALQNIGAGNTFVTENVDTCSRIVLQFPLHNGVRLVPTSGVIPTNIYTIVMLFRLDQTNGYRRLLDFKVGSPDVGLYVQTGRLYFYPLAQAPGSTIAGGPYYQVVLTRDGTNIAGYVNGVQQFDIADPSGYGVLTAANELRFFKDDTTEESSGAVARIRLYSAAMTPGQVALLDRTDCAGVPHFLTPYWQTNVLLLPVEFVIPGTPYRLQGSSNLLTWINISTSTPLSSPITLMDPKASNFMYRYYRLVTP